MKKDCNKQKNDKGKDKKHDEGKKETCSSMKIEEVNSTRVVMRMEKSYSPHVQMLHNVAMDSYLFNEQKNEQNFVDIVYDIKNFQKKQIKRKQKN